LVDLNRRSLLYGLLEEGGIKMGIHVVNIQSFNLLFDTASVQVEIGFEPINEFGLPTSSVNVTVSIATHDQLTLGELRDHALTAALSLLKQSSSETIEGLRAIYDQSQAEQADPFANIPRTGG
jgi:hypothetical protein